jgi:ATP-binding cassette, subfamily F, member 3
MLTARDLTLRRGPEPLFEQVNFTVFRGDKVGLTGANGSGKSSLLAAIRGELGADRGDLDRPANLRIAHVEQEIDSIDRAAIEFVLDGDVELRTVMAAIDGAERRDAPLELAEHHAALQAVDGYRARARAAAIMHGLGFKTADHERTVAEFSGGWRVRVGLARALNSRADLLLLDEPTNHLDLDAIVWLEEWLTSYSGTLLMISHDREFLDAIVRRVLHIENKAIRAYSGNYSQFEQKRIEELALQQALKARQVRRVAEITSFVVRFRAKASK